MIRPETAYLSPIQGQSSPLSLSRKRARQNRSRKRPILPRFVRHRSCAGTAGLRWYPATGSAPAAGLRSVLPCRQQPARLPHRRLYRYAQAVEARLGPALSSAGIVAGSCNNPWTPILIPGMAHHQNIGPCAIHRNNPDPVPGRHKTDTQTIGKTGFP